MIGVIAEKPEVGAEIAKTLSSNIVRKEGYIECPDVGLIITWCVGNMLELDPPEHFDERYKKWRLEDLPMKWPIRFSPSKSTKKQLGIIKKCLARTTEIVNAADIDNAGEWIFWGTYEHCGFKQPVKRILITDNNLIAKAWQNQKPGRDFYNNALAEKGRSIADQRFGFNISRALACQAQSQGAEGLNLKSGRVQAAILGLIRNRELTIKNFKSTNHFSINANVSDEYGNVMKNCKYVIQDTDPVNEDGLLIDEAFANGIKDELRNSRLQLTSITSKEVNDAPPLPYDLGSLQAECSRVLGFKPDKVLKLTQSLRDKKSISYNRTDSRYLSDEHHDDAPELLNVLSHIDAFEPLIEYTDTSIKTKAFNSKKVTAHHAIVPTQNISNVGDMTDDEFSVYQLIVRNYILQFLPPRVRQVVKAEWDFEGKYTFKGGCTSILSHGWSALFLKDTDGEGVSQNADDLELEAIDISGFVEGEFYEINTVDTKSLKTNPPKLYTIPTLLTDMTQTSKYVTDPAIKAMLLEKDKDTNERGGIGTSATRTPILMGLFKSQFIKEARNKTISTTETGVIIYDALPSQVTSPNQTALWAHKQKMISDGELTVNAFAEEVDDFTEEQVMAIKQGIKLPTGMSYESVSSTCPTEGCNGDAVSKKGKFGEYFTCDSCDSTFQALNGEPFPNSYTQCPKCPKQAQLRVGQKGNVYWSCKACSSNFNDDNGALVVPVEETCPKCGKSATKTRNGNWRCSGKCGFLEDKDGKPYYEQCPQCEKNDLRDYYKNRNPSNGVDYRGCSDYKGCGYRVT